MTMTTSKSYVISKHLVWDAYQRVKANRGAAGVDGVSLEAFEHRLQDNLYRIWNRLSAGSYFPPPVRRVDIPKASGGTRPLGIPTVADRVAQMVVRMSVEPLIEPIFHPWSYGYRPGRSAIDAVGVARANCWQRSWVVDVDISGFFDAIDHALLLKAVRRHVEQPWQMLCIERWLKAPIQLPDGTIVERTSGTPQGGVISPLLANLFLHYAFDAWMQRRWANIRFERYADDIICHCATQEEAEQLLETIQDRLVACGLTAHPEKTRIVYCSDDRRPGSWEHTSFVFLGYEFRRRTAVDRRGRRFDGFNPAIGADKAQTIRQRFRSLTDRRQCLRSLAEMAAEINPMIRGVWNYFGHFNKGELQRQVGYFIDKRLLHWARRKYKVVRDSWRQAGEWLRRLRRRQPTLLAHWTGP